MSTSYSLKITALSQRFSTHGDLTIFVEDASDPEVGTYSGHLCVRRDDRVDILALVLFVPIDAFPPKTNDSYIVDESDPNNVVLRVDLPSDFAFLTVVTLGDPYEYAVRTYGPAAALELFNSIHEWGALEVQCSNPSWYQHGLHAHINDPLFVDQVLGDEYVGYSVNTAGHTFGSESFAAQLEAERIIWQLEDIPIGKDDAEQQRDAAAFEAWCERALAFVLRGAFYPVLLYANKQAFQRRDVIATNLQQTLFSKRIWNNYEVHDLVFEVKNKRHIEKADIVQVANYLHAPYGRLGFLIFRSDALFLDALGAWRFRSIVLAHGNRIIELTTGKLTEMLRAFSVSGDHQLFDHDLRELLDKYEHEYINEPQPTVRPRA